MLEAPASRLFSTSSFHDARGALDHLAGGYLGDRRVVELPDALAHCRASTSPSLIA